MNDFRISLNALEIIAKLPNDKAGEVFRAAIKYITTGEIKDFQDVNEQIIFQRARLEIDHTNNKTRTRTRTRKTQRGETQ